MNQTKLMKADDLAMDFNSIVERKYWIAAVAGTRNNPEVHFNSRASMVRVVYRLSSNDFTLQFARSSAAFGDFLASASRSLAQVLTSLKAAGLEFSAPLDDSMVLRVEYNPKTKGCTIHAANLGDDWQTVEALPVKVPDRPKPETSTETVDDA